MSKLWTDKPEAVIDWSVCGLTKKMRDKYRSLSKLAIVEIAGRDSIAAAKQAARDEDYLYLLPTYVYTATEYGPWDSVYHAVERLADGLNETKVLPLIVMGSPGFWKALNGTLVSELIRQFGFYTPCIGCHLYLHAVRIPLALTLGGVPIVAGEREVHDETLKINQIPVALEHYQALAAAFGIQLIMPLRKITSGRQVEEILGFSWEQGREQMACTLSGNYRGADGRVDITSHQVDNYLKRFARPCVETILKKYIDGLVPEHVVVAQKIASQNR